MDNSEWYAALLKYLRDRWTTPVSTTELTKFYATQFGAQQITNVTDYSVRSEVESILTELHSLAFVVVNRDNTGDTTQITSAQISKHFLDVQRALRFSLSELSARGRINVQPIFQHPSPKRHDVFIAMSFSRNMDEIYECIKGCCSTANLSAHRGDENMGAHSIMHDIWSSIFHARTVIADCTDKNPNVFYEIGIAHTIGKPVILISRSASDIPFDIQHLRHIIYGNEVDTLRKQLSRMLAETTAKIEPHAASPY